METKKLTVPDLGRMKAAGERITMLTAYDWAFARLLDEAGVDLLLVGDTLGAVVQGHGNTLPVTLDEMLYHTRLVARAARRSLVVGDMPFGSYQVSPEQAVASAVRFLKEAGAEAVKLEGGIPMAATIEALGSVGIPVMGHVGLTPQSVHQIGGYRVQGRNRGHARGDRGRVLDDARAVEAAGAFAVVLECIPQDLAAEITAELTIPTLGIGAGVHCDGQVLVLHDFLGMNERVPKFVKRYADLGGEIVRAAGAYVSDVKAGAFPTDEHAYHSLVPVPAAKAK